MQEYYDLLEVRVGCKESEIKKSYRNLAKRYHPDINPQGERKFKEISNAYEWLMKNHATYVPSQPKPKPAPTPANAWWSSKPDLKPKSPPPVGAKLINRDISDIPYDKRERCYLVKLTESETSTDGIVVIKLKNDQYHRVYFSKNIGDGAIAICDQMVYKIKIVNDGDWASMFHSNWID